MKFKGFTLLETLVSIAVFTALMTIVFNAWITFQRTALKNEGKQDANSQCIKIYRDVNKYLSSSSIRYFECYNSFGSSQDAGKRWFAFLLSRKKDEAAAYPDLFAPMDYEQMTTSPILVYNTLMVYRLIYKNGCCNNFDCCPHKVLGRRAFYAKEPIYVGKTSYKFSSELQENLQYAIASEDIKDYVVVENNIIDLTVNQDDDRVSFYLSTLRIADARREFEFGTVPLTSEASGNQNFQASDKAKNYLENLSWITVPGNT